MRIAYGFYTADSGEILVDGKPRRDQQPARRHRARHRHGPPALHAGRDDDRGREHRARGRAGRRAGLDLDKGEPRHARAVRGVRARGRSAGAASRTSRSASSSGSSCSRRSTARRDLLILDEPTAVLSPQEVEEFFAHPAPHARAGQDDRHHHPQARRGAGDLRRGDRDARRQGGRRA